MKNIIKQVDDQGQLVNAYEVLGLLGTGGFAQVYQVISLQSSQKFAVKIISKITVNQDYSIYQKLAMQIKIHRKLKNKYIVSLESVFQDEQNIYLLMELCSNLTLKQVQTTRGRLTQLQVKYYVNQIIRGIEYLHLNKILHRDIKLGNIFINENMQIKLGDFGLSVRLKQFNQKRFTSCGTPNYIAPEILKNQGHSFGVDIWGLGIIIYTLLIGKPPFECETVQQTYQAIKQLKFKIPNSISISENARDLIIGILKLDPSSRMTLSDVKDHPFLSKITNRIPQYLPKQMLNSPPSSMLLKSFNSFDNFKLAVLPRRLSTIIQKVSNSNLSQKSDSESILESKKHPKLKRSLSHKQFKIDKLSLEDKNQLTITKISSSRKHLSNNSSKTKNSNIVSQKKTKIVKSQHKITKQVIYNQLDDLYNYVDWSDKFGIGYRLRSGVVGFVFNDKTCFVKIKQSYLFRDHSNEQVIYQQKEVPLSLMKKIKILKQAESSLDVPKGPSILKKQTIYITRFLKLYGTLILKVSNNCCYFVWNDCRMVLKNYKHLNWKLMTGENGDGTIHSEFSNKILCERMNTLRMIVCELTKKY